MKAPRHSCFTVAGGGGIHKLRHTPNMENRLSHPKQSHAQFRESFVISSHLQLHFEAEVLKEETYLSRKPRETRTVTSKCSLRKGGNAGCG